MDMYIEKDALISSCVFSCLIFVLSNFASISFLFLAHPSTSYSSVSVGVQHLFLAEQELEFVILCSSLLCSCRLVVHYPIHSSPS